MERIKSVDALRGFALFGIAIVNMPFFAAPMGQVATDIALDALAAFAVALLFQGKFFLVFAFLFGWGVGVQQASAERAGRAFAPRFFRRQAGLFLIGAAHAVLVFPGDILVTYAITGLLLFAVRRSDVTGLMRWSLAGIAAGIVSLATLGILIGELAHPNAGSAAAYLGNFAQVLQQRVTDLATAFPFIVMFNGPLVFAAFCAGLAAQRSGFLAPGNALFARLWRVRAGLLCVGVAANVPYALTSAGLIAGNIGALAAFSSLALAAPLLTVAYVTFVAGWAQARGEGALTAAGKMSLTAYVFEGVLAGFVFHGYGLALFGQLGMGAVTAIAILIFLATETACQAWSRAFGQGPLERLLRVIAG
jgi:uncharacterized protein